MEASPDGQVSLTDPDARSMASQGKGTGIVGYNMQTAVETQHHQGVDGRHPLPESTTTEGERRDGPARTGIQLEASDEDHGYRAVDRGAPRLIGAVSERATIPLASAKSCRLVRAEVPQERTFGLVT